MKKINPGFIKTISLMTLMAIFAIPLYAQPPQGRGTGPGAGRGAGAPGMGRGPMGQASEESVKEMVDNLAKTFEFTDKQKSDLLEFEMDMYKKNAIERQKLAGDREAMMTYMQEQRELRDKKYAEIMTKEQLARYQELQQNRMPQRQGPQQDQPQGQGQQQEGEIRQRGRGR